MTSRDVYVDADILKYSIGFAAQKTIWIYRYSSEEFEGKTAAKNWYKEAYGEPLSEEDWDTRVEVEPWENCRYSLENKIAEIEHNTEADKLIMCLSPKKTFRDDVAFTRVYKGNRVSAKPEHAEKIVEYIKENYEYIEGDNVEADDVMGMHQTTDTVIATTDKDLDMIPGEHYNLSSGEMYLVDELAADRFFFIQLLAGDSTDNIQGIPKVGMKIAARTVDSFAGDTQGLVERIQDMYEEHYPLEGKEVMEEMAALVWILRKGETPETAGWRKFLR